MDVLAQRIGPGSFFTGVRIGLAALKRHCYCTGYSADWHFMLETLVRQVKNRQAGDADFGGLRG
ncbi:MAG: hypothetical protein H6908_04760 [Hyphomicrobiales bacterium]|nr:hypothetical protein [Hyphomicrobiales bacterium]